MYLRNTRGQGEMPRSLDCLRPASPSLCNLGQPPDPLGSNLLGSVSLLLLNEGEAKVLAFIQILWVVNNTP